MWDDRFEAVLRTYLPFLGPSEELTAETDLRELGLDSLATVELLAVLEDEYDVRFADDDLSLETFASPGVLWAAVDRMRAVA